MNSHNNDICVDWFYHTECLIYVVLNDKYDAKTRPQGITLGKFSIPKEHQNDTDDDDNVVNANT